MKKKQCSNPRHGDVFVETDEAFSLGVCPVCGMELMEVAPPPSPQSPPTSSEAKPVQTTRSRKTSSAKPGAPFGDARPRVHKPRVKPASESLPPEPPEKPISEPPVNPVEPPLRKAPTADGPRLVVVDRHGKDRLVFPLHHDQIAIGRRSSRNLPPDLDLADVDDTHAVGREHLVIFRLGGEWHVRALGSRSATFINETLLSADQTQQLRNGDKIVLGADQGVGLLFENP